MTNIRTYTFYSSWTWTTYTLLFSQYWYDILQMFNSKADCCIPLYSSCLHLWMDLETIKEKWLWKCRLGLHGVAFSTPSLLNSCLILFKHIHWCRCICDSINDCMIAFNCVYNIILECSRQSLNKPNCENSVWHKPIAALATLVEDHHLIWSNEAEQCNRYELANPLCLQYAG